MKFYILFPRCRFNGVAKCYRKPHESILKQTTLKLFILKRSFSLTKPHLKQVKNYDLSRFNIKNNKTQDRGDFNYSF